MRRTVSVPQPLTERDISRVLRSQSLSQRRTWFFIPVSIAASLLLAIGALNSAIPRSTTESPVFASELTSIQTLTPAFTSTQAVVAASESTPQPAAEVPSFPDSTVVYDSFSISAPISWDAPLGSNDIYKRLENGVVHLEGTAKPGQKGSVVLFGHSSDLPWRGGSFKTVFAPIVSAKANQEIQVSYQNVLYRYTITRSFEVSPNELHILSSKDDGLLRLVTCTPIGTNLRRFVVEARQISPDPSGNQDFTATPLNGQSLPGDL